MSNVRHRRSHRQPEALPPERRQPEVPMREMQHPMTAGNQPLLATNTGVRLACTMAAMLSVLAIFLCWTERESRVIRRFAVQSAALAALHISGGAVLVVISVIVGSVPYFGFLMTLMGWLIYIGVVIVVLYLRVRLMEHAWHGRRMELPLCEGLLRRFYPCDTEEAENHAA